MTPDPDDALTSGPNPGRPADPDGRQARRREERYLVRLEFVARPLGADGMPAPDAIEFSANWPPMGPSALLGLEIALHRFLGDSLRLGAVRAMGMVGDPAKVGFLATMAKDGPEAALAMALGGRPGPAPPPPDTGLVEACREVVAGLRAEVRLAGLAMDTDRASRCDHMAERLRRAIEGMGARDREER